MIAFLFLLLGFTSFAPPSNRGALNGTALVHEVCARTSDSDFCLQTLRSDTNSATAESLAGDIAIAALRLAQTKAILNHRLIVRLLSNASASADDRQLLDICRARTSDAISRLSSANNSFNSDSLDGVVEGVNEAASAAEKCRISVAATSDLARLYSDLVKLCQICEVSTRYFSVEDFN